MANDPKYISKLTIPDNTGTDQSYDIKDAGAARTSHTHGNIQNDGVLQTTDITIANGDKLVVTDASDGHKIARSSTAFDGSSTGYYLSKKGTFEPISSIGNFVKYDDVLMPVNPFGGKKLYINSMDNAFASANLKYWAKVTTHKLEINGVTYPYIDTTKTMADDDYFVDSPVVSTLSNVYIFDGNYETNCSCPANHYMKIHIQFAPFTDNWTASGGATWSGYPYGSYFLSYYNTNTPAQASQVRVYNKYAQHTIGWHLYTMTAYAGTLGSSGYIERLSDESDYLRSCVEFIVYGKTSGTAQVTQVDYKLSRPNLSNNGATVTKFGAQSLYHTFSWYQHNENAQNTTTTSIGPSGLNAPSAIGAVAVANGDRIIIADSSNSNKMTPAVLFDGSTTSKILSKKGKWVTPTVGTQSVKLKFTGESMAVGGLTTASATDSTSPTITGTITTGIVSGSTINSNYTPSGTITNGTITIGSGTNASNLLTSSVAPTATQVLTSASIPEDGVIVDGNKKYFHPSASGGSVGTPVGTSQSVLTGKTTKYMSATASGISASSDTAVNAYTSINTSSTTTATWTKTYTQITGTTDDYELTFDLTEGAAVTNIDVLTGIGFNTTSVSASTHTHGAPTVSLVENDTTATGRLEYVKSATEGSAASTTHTHSFTQPTISLGSNSTSADGVQYIESVTSGNPTLTINKAWTDTFASQPTLSRETAIKTLGTISQGTTTFSGDQVTFSSSHSLNAQHSHDIPALTVSASATPAGTITSDGTTETFTTGKAGDLTMTEES